MMFDVDVDCSCDLFLLIYLFGLYYCTNVAFALSFALKVLLTELLFVVDDCICWECSISIGE